MADIFDQIHAERKGNIFDQIHAERTKTPDPVVAALQKFDAEGKDTTYMGALGHVLASPVTGLLGIPGQVYDWVTRPNVGMGTGGFMSEEPVTDAFQNAIGTFGPEITSSLKAAVKPTGKAIWGGIKGGAAAIPTIKTGALTTLGSSVGTMIGGAEGAKWGAATGATLAGLEGIFQGARRELFPPPPVKPIVPPPALRSPPPGFAAPVPTLHWPAAETKPIVPPPTLRWPEAEAQPPIVPQPALRWPTVEQPVVVPPPALRTSAPRPVPIVPPPALRWPAVEESGEGGGSGGGLGPRMTPQMMDAVSRTVGAEAEAAAAKRKSLGGIDWKEQFKGDETAQKLHLNKTWHSLLKDMELDGSPAGTKAPSADAASQATYGKRWMEGTPDQMFDLLRQAVRDRRSPGYVPPPMTKPPE